MSKLKPCPFCGGSARIIKTSWSDWNLEPQDFSVKCNACSAGIRQYYPTEEEAVEVWNKRVNEELEFTRQFIHDNGLEFALAAAWERRKKDAT